MHTANELLNHKKRKIAGRQMPGNWQRRSLRMKEMETALQNCQGTEILERIMHSDIENLKETLETVDRTAFEAAIGFLEQADTIYVVGVRSCEPLASFLGFYLNLLFDRVKVVTSSGATEIFEQIFRIGSKDVMVGISFPRYSMRTLKALELAASRNAKVITITDSVHSPMKLYSTCNLTASSEMVSVMDSLTAPLSLINGLVAALCMRQKERVSSSLEMLEQVWEEYEVFAPDEMNQVEKQVEWKNESNKEDV